LRPASDQPESSAPLVEVDAYADPLTAIAGADAAIDDERIIRSGRLAGKGMWQSIWILAVPVMIQQMTAALVGTTDTLLAGNLPAEVTAPALDGIGFGASFMWIATIIMAGLGIGAQAISARAMGSGNPHEARAAGGTGLVASLIAGAIGGVAVWFSAPAIGTFVGLSAEANVYATEYVRFIALGMPALGVMTVGGMTLHGVGEAARPSAIAVAVNVVNVLASWFISGVVLQFGTLDVPNPSPLNPLDWGVFGIASGTALSYVVGGVLTWVVMHRGVKDFKISRADLRVRGPMMRRIATIGIPNMLEGGVMWLTTSIGVVWFIGEVAAAEGVGGVPRQGLFGAHMIAVRWEAFSFLPGFAMGTAAGALAGQYLGAGSAVLARRAIMLCLWIGIAIMAAFGVVFMLFGTELAQFMTRDPVAVEEVPKLLFICGLVQVPFALGIVLRQALKGCGDTRWTFVITLFSMVLIRIPLAWLFGVVLEMGLAGIWIGLCVELPRRHLPHLHHRPQHQLHQRLQRQVHVLRLPARCDDHDAYTLSYEQIHEKIAELVAIGGTQILMQGGMNPDLPLDWYLDLLREIKRSSRKSTSTPSARRRCGVRPLLQPAGRDLRGEGAAG
jgi:putative MATE family efflux protein